MPLHLYVFLVKWKCMKKERMMKKIKLENSIKFYIVIERCCIKMENIFVSGSLSVSLSLDRYIYVNIEVYETNLMLNNIVRGKKTNYIYFIQLSDWMDLRGDSKKMG